MVLLNFTFLRCQRYVEGCYDTTITCSFLWAAHGHYLESKLTQPLDEWSRPQWSEPYVLFICAEDSQMMEEMSFISSSVPQSTSYTRKLVNKLGLSHLPWTFVVQSLKNTCNSAVVHPVTFLGWGQHQFSWTESYTSLTSTRSTCRNCSLQWTDNSV